MRLWSARAYLPGSHRQKLIAGYNGRYTGQPRRIRRASSECCITRYAAMAFSESRMHGSRPMAVPGIDQQTFEIIEKEIGAERFSTRGMYRLSVNRKIIIASPRSDSFWLQISCAGPILRRYAIGRTNEGSR